MATLKLIVRRDKGIIRVNPKGETTIYVQYGHAGKAVLFTTKIILNPEFLEFDTNNVLHQTAPIKRSFPGYSIKNSNIRKLANEISSIADTLVNQKIAPTIDAVQSVYKEENAPTPKEASKTFMEMMADFISESKATKSKATTDRYNTSYKHLKEFEVFSKDKITLEKMNLRFYDKYLAYLTNEKGMAKNTIGTQMKDLKVFLNHISKRGIPISPDVKEFKVFTEEITKIYLTQEELEILHKHDFSDNERLERVRDLYVLQCSTGLRISDLLRLSKVHIQGGNIIKMTAHKTLKNIIVPINPKAAFILKKYDYKLPKVSEQRINKNIKVACQLAGITSPVEVVREIKNVKTFTKYFKYELISSHTAVKTFITHCGERGISAKVVGEITGKTVKVILDHYYGCDEKTIEFEMQRAFGMPETHLKAV